MDPVSAAASIWALVEGTVKLSKALKDVSKASSDIKSLQKELAILYWLLCVLTNLEQRCAVPDDGSRNTLRTLGLDHGPLAEYSKVLARLQSKVDNGHSKRKLISWVFSKDEVVEMLDKIERLKSAIILVLNIDQVQTSMATHLSLDGINGKLDRMQDDSRLQEAMDWISKLDFRANKESHLSQLEAGAVDWFLDSPEIQHWRNKPGQTLLCEGIPGAGKSILAARLCDCLEKQYVRSSSSAGLAYIFFDYKTEAEQSVSQLLGAVLKQLVQSSDNTLVDQVLVLYENHLEKKTFPGPDELFRAIKSVVAQQDVAYVIVDALDEYRRASRQRRELIRLLSRLHVEAPNVSLLVASRPFPELTQDFPHAAHMEVKAMAKHIEDYISRRSSGFVVKLDDKLRDEIAAAVASKTDGMFLLARFVVDHFERLHTKRQIRNLVRSLTEPSSSHQSPKELYREAYQDTMTRIEKQPAEDRDLAQRVLQWVSTSARQLTAQELRCALSIELEDNDFDEDNVRAADLITGVCAGLIVIDDTTQIIRLVHLTAQEYLEDQQQGRLERIHEEIASTCLTYLCFDLFRTQQASREDTKKSVMEKAQALCLDRPSERQVGAFQVGGHYAHFDYDSNSGSNSDSADAPQPSTDVPEAPPFQMIPSWSVHYKLYDVNSNDGARTQEHSIVSEHSSQVNEIQTMQRMGSSSGSIAYALLDYAANFWAHHARSCEHRVQPFALALLRDQPLAAQAFQMANGLHEQWPFLDVPRSGPSRITGLHLVAAHGLVQTSESFLKLVDQMRTAHADVRDDGRRTPLMWAAHHGHAELVRHLLERKDVDISKSCGRGDTALHYAARQGHASIVELLLFHCGGSVPKLEASENLFGETPLVQAVLEGQSEAASILLRRGSNSVHSEVMFGLWPIHLAAQRRPVSTFEFLVKACKASLDIKDPKGYSPFTVAVDWGNEDIVRYFFREQAAWIRGNDEEVIKSAHLAAAHWKRLSILQLIHDEAAHLGEFRDSSGRTVTEAAADAMNMEAVITLSANGSQRYAVA